jgi:hypothetical protein
LDPESGEDSSFSLAFDPLVIRQHLFERSRDIAEERFRSVVHQGLKLEADRCLNAYAERLIGSIHRECLDHIVVFGGRHLRHVLLSYMDHQSGTRTRLLLSKDAPISRAVETAGRILGRPILGGLHRQYGRI